MWPSHKHRRVLICFEKRPVKMQDTSNRKLKDLVDFIWSDANQTPPPKAEIDAFIARAELANKSIERVVSRPPASGDIVMRSGTAQEMIDSSVSLANGYVFAPLNTLADVWARLGVSTEKIAIESSEPVQGMTEEQRRRAALLKMRMLGKKDRLAAEEISKQPDLIEKLVESRLQTVKQVCEKMLQELKHELERVRNDVNGRYKSVQNQFNSVRLQIERLRHIQKTGIDPKTKSVADVSMMTKTWTEQQDELRQLLMLRLEEMNVLSKLLKDAGDNFADRELKIRKFCENAHEQLNRLVINSNVVFLQQEFNRLLLEKELLDIELVLQNSEVIGSIQKALEQVKEIFKKTEKLKLKK